MKNHARLFKTPVLKATTFVQQLSYSSSVPLIYTQVLPGELCAAQNYSAFDSYVFSFSRRLWFRFQLNHQPNPNTHANAGGIAYTEPYTFAFTLALTFSNSNAYHGF